MEIKIKYLGGKKFLAQCRQHKLIIDQPLEKGGEDLGMSPLELFLSALGSCTAVYAKTYCQGAGIDADNLEVNISSNLTADKPVRFKDISIGISLGVDIAERKNALLQFVSNCPVHNTIKANPEVKFVVQ